MKKNPEIEQGKRDYDKMVDGVKNKLKLLPLLHCLILSYCVIQPLEAEDIVSCILYALSTPPRMQVCD